MVKQSGYPSTLEIMLNFDKLSNDVVVPLNVSRAMRGGISKWTDQRHPPPLKRIPISESRFGHRVGDIRAHNRGGESMMAHSAELITKMRNLLLAEYPENSYRYETERGLPQNSSMRPDISIFDRADACVCAVEIGYTRPEKLTAYRQQYKIPDVRWYDKTGNLHTSFERPVVRAQIELSPCREFRVYQVDNAIPCEECAELEWGESEDYNYAFEDVSTTIVTDCIKAFLVCCCDKCGSAWLADDLVVEAGALLLELTDLNTRSWEILGRIVQRGTWEEVQEYFGVLEVAPLYEAGMWVDPTYKGKMETQELRIRRDIAGRPPQQSP